MKTGNKGYSTNQGLFWTVFGIVVLGLILLMVTGTLQYRPQPLAAEGKPFDHKGFCKDFGDNDNKCTSEIHEEKGKIYGCKFEDRGSKCVGKDKRKDSCFKPSGTDKDCYKLSGTGTKADQENCVSSKHHRLCKWNSEFKRGAKYMTKNGRCVSWTTQGVVNCKSTKCSGRGCPSDLEESRELNKQRCNSRTRTGTDKKKRFNCGGCAWKSKGSCVKGDVTDVKPTPPPPPKPPTCTSCGEGTTCDDGKCVCSETGCEQCDEGDYVNSDGKCAPIPDGGLACTREYSPVCDCEGNKYPNSCNAHAAGVIGATAEKCKDG